MKRNPERKTYIVWLVVPRRDGRVPLRCPLGPIYLEPEPEKNWRGRDEDVLAVLGSISSTFYTKLLRAQIPKTPSQVVSLFVRFRDLCA